MTVDEWISTRWSVFTYNYGWAGWVSYIDGWVPRFSLFFPIVGYLILVNDTVTDWLTFVNLAGSESSWGIGGGTRLRLLYFGLLFLGGSNLVYRLRRPYLFRFGTNLIDYTRSGLEFFTYGDFLEMHGRIRNDGHISPAGKYYDSEWDGFSDAANNTDEGRNSVKRDGNWEEAKRQYGSLLRSILRETFYHENRSRRLWLTCCILLSTVGYGCLAIPSVDLFTRVVISTVPGLAQ